MVKFKFLCIQKSLVLAVLGVLGSALVACASDGNNRDEIAEKRNLFANACNQAMQDLWIAETLKGPNPRAEGAALKHYREAATKYVKALNLGVEISSDVLALLSRNTGLAFFESENWEEAIKYYKMAINHGEKPRDHARIAMAYMEYCKGIDNARTVSEHYLRAAKHLETYLQQDQQASAAYYFDAYKVYSFLGDKERASYHLEKAKQKDPLKTQKYLAETELALTKLFFLRGQEKH